MTTNGAYYLLCSLSNRSDGIFPCAGVVQGSDGDFYGTTYRGGALDFGTIFRTTSNGVLTTLFSFNDTNGSFPYAGLRQAADGNFYGATSSGGSYSNGTIFRITPSGAFSNLYSFTGGSDGRGPAAKLLEGADGNFFGTTAYGGSYGFGTAFRINPNGLVTTLAQFDGFNGANPQAPLMQATDGNFYGTTQNGGANGKGVVFRLSQRGPGV